MINIVFGGRGAILLVNTNIFKKCSTTMLKVHAFHTKSTYIISMIVVFYCKCCNLIGYSTRYLFLDR